MEQILINHLRKSEGTWFKKVELYLLADENGYSPETCGRTLRHLANEGKIKVAYYDGKFAKHLAKYSYKPQEPKTLFKEIIKEDGSRVMQLI